MSEIAHLASTLFKRAARARRVVVAIAGPPGAGKSTVAEQLAMLLPEGAAAVVPMDGFHFDDRVLEARGLASRKGAPETFDFGGFEALLKRLRAVEPDVAIPLFDRTMELSRAGAAIVGEEVRFVLVEGNYLLLDEEPWTRLAALFDVSVFLDVPRDELERRLRRRWRDLGRADGDAWVEANDMPNVDRVLARRRPADIVV
ncbi:MAG TPA: nucleoside/nucleotide kinase family protein [Rhizobiales bacterium]|nr:nucleoside/nucleotide kinase family protein [Hyphomicrobiales bacterium]